MDSLGIISGTMPLLDLGIFDHLKRETFHGEAGQIEVLTGKDLVFISRHGHETVKFTPPHLVPHLLHFKALAEIGVREVIGIYSTGSLKVHLKPGMLVAPDDFICLYPTATSVTNAPHHITPVIDDRTRKNIIAAAEELNLDLVAGGIYWQTAGPRLETRAEIRMMAGAADLVGMTLASEAVLAGELGISFGAICSVDNYAHGIGNAELKEADIRIQARRNAENIGRIISRYIEHFRIRTRPAGRV